MGTAAIALEKHAAPVKAAWLRRRLNEAKDRLERERPSIKITAIKTADGCGHGCRHCGANCGPYREETAIGLEIVEEARKRGFFKHENRPYLTGGEAIDNPLAGEILRKTFGRIPLSNGFARVRDPEERKEILGYLGSSINCVSFHLFDRANLGRHELIRHQITDGGLATLQIIVELGNEAETARYFFRTVLELARDGEIIARMKANAGMYAGYSDDLPFITLARKGPMILTRAGRGKNLNGIWIPDAVIAPRYTGTMLAPDGTLLSEFFDCHSFREMGIGTIYDSRERLRETMKGKYADFVKRQLAKSDEELLGEIELNREAAMMNCKVKLAFWNACRDEESGIPEIVERAKEALKAAGVEFDAARMIGRGVKNAEAALNWHEEPRDGIWEIY